MVNSDPPAPQANRRALIIAPSYDGRFLHAIPGGRFVTSKIAESLTTHGNYNCKVIQGEINRAQLRKEIRHFSNTDGSLLFYFYGHGLINQDEIGFLCTSDAIDDDEGLTMLEVVKQIIGSDAIEAIAVLDCCHSGNALNDCVSVLSTSLMDREGRAVFASCSPQEEAWIAHDAECEQSYSGFAQMFLKGISGQASAAMSVSGAVRAGTLSSYLSEQFGDWTQRPQAFVKDGGDHLITISSGFRLDTPELPASEKNCVYFGIPFRPSQQFVGRAAEIDSLETTVLGRTHQVAVSASVEGVNPGAKRVHSPEQNWATVGF